MDIVVIEDESKIRQGIVKLINEEFNNFNVIGEASNGLDGYELIKNTPAEIVITDIKMPKLDGIQMIKKLKEDGISKYYVILSGYADFNYAKEAITFGVREYLLKPITVDDLRDVLNKIETEYNKNSINPNDVFYSLLVDGEGDVRVLHKYIKAEKGFLVMFYMKEKQPLEMFLPKYYLMTQMKINYGNFYILLLRDEDNFLQTLSNIIKTIKLKERCICSYVKAEDFSKLSEYYGVIRRYLKWSISINEDIITEDVTKNLKLEKLQYPTAIEKQMIQAINHGKFNELEKVIYQFIEYFKDKLYHPGEILEAYLSFSTNLINSLRYVYKYVLQDISQAVLLDNLLGCYTYEQLESWLIQLLKSILGKIENNNVSFVVYKALEIIHNEYNKEINLESVANRINVTSEYLSSLFSKEMNKSFLNYLTEYRINFAKEQLLEGKLKTVDIARNVGYTSEKYFFSVFKKVTGMSPGKYVTTYKST
jgi:Response regulator containing CheY-like receiver domain and AraC-type DNA-binding domain